MVEDAPEGGYDAETLMQEEVAQRILGAFHSLLGGEFGEEFGEDEGLFGEEEYEDFVHEHERLMENAG